jgi:hypothetical protein
MNEWWNEVAIRTSFACLSRSGKSFLRMEIVWYQHFLSDIKNGLVSQNSQSLAVMVVFGRPAPPFVANDYWLCVLGQHRRF